MSSQSNSSDVSENQRQHDELVAKHREGLVRIIDLDGEVWWVRAHMAESYAKKTRKRRDAVAS